jgi:hypothetical protein
MNVSRMTTLFAINVTNVVPAGQETQAGSGSASATVHQLSELPEFPLGLNVAIGCVVITGAA